MNFHTFALAVNKQFSTFKTEVFYVDVERDELFQVYLAAFPAGTDPLYKVNSEHNCNCCKQFIRNVGHIVTVNSDYSLNTIWDIKIDTEPVYQIVADTLSNYVKQKAIAGVFRTSERAFGKEYTRESTMIKHSHFFFDKIPNNLYIFKDDLATKQGDLNTNRQMLESGLTEITAESCSIVKELIDQNSLYRGQEFLPTVKSALNVINKYSNVPQQHKHTFLWVASVDASVPVRFKNSVIGTLLYDLSHDVDVEAAVRSFESKVAPTNYKRPTALITKAMIEQAKETVNKLGLQTALIRRHAVVDDITINNVLFADRSTSVFKSSDNILDNLSVKESAKNYSKVQEVTIDQFISTIIPNSTSLELMVENRHENNFMTLIAPVHTDIQQLFKWDNNFSWSYNGNVTDSIKERVKKAGGDVDGYLRVSLSWFNTDDLDLHCNFGKSNKRDHIYFGNKRGSYTKGVLDVDMNAFGNLSRTPVENITWKTKTDLTPGQYSIDVNQFTCRNNTEIGFTLEIEWNNQITNYHYTKKVSSNINVCKFEVNEQHEVTSITVSPNVQTDGYVESNSQNIWGIDTNTWVPVSLMMLSPNHWDDKQFGNKHWFFMLKDCKNPNAVRGFYNEFLVDSLTKHRKVFEVLGNDLKIPYDDNQLSGVGFSSTNEDSILCRVSGALNRVVKIKF